MEKRTKIFLVIVSILIILGIAACALNTTAISAKPSTPAGRSTKTITDMTGRTVVVPTDISRVLSTGPPTTIEVYVLAPDKLIGVNFDANPTNGSVYIPDKYRSLPNVGGWFGKQTGNYENFIAMHPDIILDSGSSADNSTSAVEERQEKLGVIPVIGVMDSSNVTLYNPSIQFLGTLLGAENQAASLSEFYNRVMSTVQLRVASIPESEKVRVYYAEGPTGLQTDPAGSSHSELIELAGGINVADCIITPGMGMTPVSMEQVTTWNPDVIIVGDPGFYRIINNDTLWRPIRAVKNHRVYLVPQ